MPEFVHTIERRRISRPEQPPRIAGGSAGRAACGPRWGGPEVRAPASAARRAIDGERGGGTIRQRWADPSHQPRAHRRESPPPPRVQSMGAAWGTSFRARRRGPCSGTRAQGGRGCAGRRPPAATGRFGLDCGGAVLTVNRGLQPVRPQSCGRARTRLRLRGRAGKLGSDAQIGRERARSAKGRRGQVHGNYALNAHLAHRCPQLPGERAMKSAAGAALSAPKPVGAAR